MEELPGCPLFYKLPDVASYVRARCPPTPVFVAALARLGFHCSQVHCEASGIKTDCPPPVLFAVMLRWKQLADELEPGPEGQDAAAKRRPSGGNGLDRGAFRIQVSPLMEADFGYDRQYDFRRQVTGIAKFIPNLPGWGPKRRHQGLGPTTNDEA
ncbi:unnamed protein product [Phytomonas sp. Hart1]|nr:unnamed protein product [Phytomonas sp. Hart1]|eukprot:CCW66796.1 unnamed protein product [Phytomonas sp. isolate Hart1]